MTTVDDYTLSVQVGGQSFDCPNENFPLNGLPAIDDMMETILDDVYDNMYRDVLMMALAPGLCMGACSTDWMIEISQANSGDRFQAGFSLKNPNGDVLYNVESELVVFDIGDGGGPGIGFDLDRFAPIDHKGISERSPMVAHYQDEWAKLHRKDREILTTVVNSFFESLAAAIMMQ